MKIDKTENKEETYSWKVSQRAIHLSGSGYQECAGIRMSIANAITAEEFDKRRKKY